MGFSINTREDVHKISLQREPTALEFQCGYSIVCASSEPLMAFGSCTISTLDWTLSERDAIVPLVVKAVELFCNTKLLS